MTIHNAIKEAISHFGGRAKASDIIQFINQKYPDIKIQSIRFALYCGSNTNPKTGYIYRKIRRGIYELN